MSASLRRKLLLLLVVGVVAVLLPWAQRWLSAAGRPGSAVAAPSVLLRGTLRLTGCDIGRRGSANLGSVRAFCATLQVPEDWERPAGRQIGLKLAIVRSQSARSADDLVTFLDGGPGEAATDDYPAIANALLPLRWRRDVLLIDQRGTGGSNALTCGAPSADNDSNASAEAHSEDVAADLERVRQCLAAVSTHAAAEHYATTDAVRDLEAVRLALGGPPLDLIGISYGTRVAQQYAQHYPHSVRNVVLDSAVPNPLALGSDHARNLEQALQSMARRCGADAACQRQFGDSYATLYRLRDRLRAHPQPLSVRDPQTFEPRPMTLTADDLAAIVRLYSYSPLTAALLPLMLQQADQGNFAPLLSQKKFLADDLAGVINGGMELSVICTEDADLLQVRAEDAQTLLGNAQITKIQSACSVWPKGVRPADFHQSFQSTLPVLVLTGTNDPVTPPAYAEQIAHALPHARVLVARGQGHSVLAAGCMPRLVADFINSADVTALNDRCLRSLGDTPAFIDYNGAAP